MPQRAASLGRRREVRIADRHAGALRSERLGDRRPDAAGASGDRHGHCAEVVHRGSMGIGGRRKRRTVAQMAYQLLLTRAGHLDKIADQLVASRRRSRSAHLTLLSQPRRIAALLLLSCLGLVAVPVASARYKPSKAALDRHRVPAWYTDAKLGIMIQWNGSAVPAYAPTERGQRVGGFPYTGVTNYAEWYWRIAAWNGTAAQKHHAETYGADVTYDDLVQRWKGEKVRAAAMAEAVRGRRREVLRARGQAP
jgi:hypothetical protein